MSCARYGENTAKMQSSKKKGNGGHAETSLPDFTRHNALVAHCQLCGCAAARASARRLRAGLYGRRRGLAFQVGREILRERPSVSRHCNPNELEIRDGFLVCDDRQSRLD